MFCFNCGQQLPDGATFCVNCGTNLSSVSSGQPVLQSPSQASPLVPAKCTNCGGVLEISPTSEAAVCPFCKSAFVVKQAIQNYNLNIHSSTVNIANANINAGPSVDNLLIRAEEFITKHDFKTARSYYEQVLDLDVNNQRAREGLNIIDNYVHTVFRINTVFVDGQQLLGHQYFLTAFFSKFLIEHVYELNVRKTTIIPYSAINGMGKLCKGKITSGVYFDTLSGKSTKMNIVAETGRSADAAAEQIMSFFYDTAFPQKQPDYNTLRQEGEAIVRNHFYNNKPSIFSSSGSLLFEATYKYMRHVHVPFGVAYPIVRGIAYPEKR